MEYFINMNYYYNEELSESEFDLSPPSSDDIKPVPIFPICKENIKKNKRRTKIIQRYNIIKREFIEDILDGNLESIKTKIKLNIDPNLTHDNTSAFVYALNTDNHNNHQIIKELLKAGANPNICDVHGRTHIFYAKDPTIINLLIEAGTDINSQDRDGNTPLMIIQDPNNINKYSYYRRDAEERDEENIYSIVEFYLKSGTNPFIKNNEGQNIYILENKEDYRMKMKLNGEDPNRLVIREDIKNLIIEYSVKYYKNKIKEELEEIGKTIIPKDIMEMILLRRDQQKYCKHYKYFKFELMILGNYLNVSKIQGLSGSSGSKIRIQDKTSEELCMLISKILSSGRKY